MMIDAGELREIIEIVKIEYIQDENGFDDIEKVEVVHTLRAKKKTIGTKEYISANSNVAKLTYNFICRKREIDNTMFVLYKDKLFNIKHVHEFEDNMFIQITCEVVE